MRILLTILALLVVQTSTADVTVGVGSTFNGFNSQKRLGEEATFIQQENAFKLLNDKRVPVEQQYTRVQSVPANTEKSFSGHDIKGREIKH
jgi:hypothetical protein